MLTSPVPYTILFRNPKLSIYHPVSVLVIVSNVDIRPSFRTLVVLEAAGFSTQNICVAIARHVYTYRDKT